MADDMTIRIDHRDLGVAQRKLFHLLLWHYFKTGGQAASLEIPVESLNAHLKMSGAVEKRLLLYGEKLAATPLRWTRLRAGSPVESGFCALVSECRIHEGRLSYAFPDKLRELLRHQAHLDRLELQVTDLFRHAYSTPLYELARTLTDVETGGWWTLDALRTRLDAGPSSDFDSLHAVRSRVLTPALEEINALSELEVTVEYRQPVDAAAAVKLRVVRKDDDGAAACLRIPGEPRDLPDAELADQQAFEAFKAEKVCELTQVMSDEDMEQFRRAFLKSIRDNAVLMRKYEKEGFDSLAIKLGFEVFLEEMLLSDRERDFDRFRSTSAAP